MGTSAASLSVSLGLQHSCAIGATQVEPKVSTIKLSSTLPAKQNSKLGLSLEQVLTLSGLIFFSIIALELALITNTSLFLGSFKNKGQFKIIWTVKQAPNHSTCLEDPPNSGAVPCSTWDMPRGTLWSHRWCVTYLMEQRYRNTLGCSWSTCLLLILFWCFVIINSYKTNLYKIVWVQLNPN